MSQEVLQNFTGLFKHCCPYCLSMYFTTHRTFMHQLKQPSYINEKHNKINMLKIKHATDAILPPAGKNELQFSGRFCPLLFFQPRSFISHFKINTVFHNQCKKHLRMTKMGRLNQSFMELLISFTTAGYTLIVKQQCSQSLQQDKLQHQHLFSHNVILQ